MDEVSFCALKIGDKFMFNGEEWTVTETEKSGGCGCTPHANAVKTSDGTKALYNCNHMVVKL